MIQMIAATPKLALPTSIAVINPKCPAIAAVTNGAKKLSTRPQLKIDAAVDRRCGGYSSASQGPQITLEQRQAPSSVPTLIE